MSNHTLQSAHALLAAKSYPAARRAVQGLLNGRPNDPVLLAFAVEIEREAGDHRKALELVRDALRIAPDNAQLRELEIRTVATLRWKKEAGELLVRFEQDFPHQRWRIDGLRVTIDSLHERAVSLKSRIDQEAETAGESPAALRAYGIAYHKINDLFRAQRLLLAAQPSFPGDVELDETLAVNSFQLVRPATARRYATLAVAAAPERSRMRHLRALSYLLYLPPFFVFAHLMLLVTVSSTIVGKYGSWVVALALPLLFGALLTIWYDLVSVALQWPAHKYLIGVFVLFAAAYFTVINARLHRRFFERQASVKIRKY